MAITASQVKELREITGAGMMDCKKALVATDGDVKKAIDWLREKGISKAAKKEGRTAADGLSKVVVNGNRAVIVELNSETDFVAKNEKFLGLLDDCVNAINCFSTSIIWLLVRALPTNLLNIKSSIFILLMIKFFFVILY